MEASRLRALFGDESGEHLARAVVTEACADGEEKAALERLVTRTVEEIREKF